MKKLFVFALLMTGIAASSFAQTEGPKAEKKDMKMGKKEMKAKPAKAAKKEVKEDKKESKGK